MSIFVQVEFLYLGAFTFLALRLLFLFSEYLGAYITNLLACLILPIFWGEKNLKLLISILSFFHLNQRYGALYWF